ncbi:hypothetical protein [Natronospora cellulosivora (SeqCode)]
MKSKNIKISSYFPTSTEVVWSKLQEFETLSTITKPHISFKAKSNKKFKWHEGKKYLFKLRLYKIIPAGEHEIYVDNIDKENYEIQTYERNKIVTTWNHLIKLEGQKNGNTLYTDYVEIYAGIFTGLVACWSRFFYKCRQKKWIKILEEN